MNKITQLVQSLSQTLENSYPLDTVLKYVNGYTKRRCTKFKPLLTMICRPNLEKSIFKLMQNLTSKLHCNGFLSPGECFPAVRGDIVTIVSFQYFEHFIRFVQYFWSIYLKGFTHVSFVHIWRYGDCSQVNPAEFSMALFGVFCWAGWLPVTF